MELNYYKHIKDNYLVNKTNLQRYGSIGDGGYFLSPSSIVNSDLLFSGGISSNVEFEFDYFRFNPTGSILMIDPTISRTKLLFKGIMRLFFKRSRKISYLYNTLIFWDLIYQERCKHLPIWLKKPKSILKLAKSNFGIDNNVLLKLDIEGSEYDFLEEIINHQKIFSAMVFEFHDLDKRSNLLLNFISKIKANFDLVNIEINPSGGFVNKLPKCIEVTFERK